MPLNPEARRARARLAAHRRWHPGDDLDQLTEQCLREIEISNIDDGIDDLVAQSTDPRAATPGGQKTSAAATGQTSFQL